MSNNVSHSGSKTLGHSQVNRVLARQLNFGRGVRWRDIAEFIEARSTGQLTQKFSGQRPVNRS